MPSLKKSTIAAVVILLALLAGSMLLLRNYELDLIHPVVVNTVLQKAPEEYSSNRVRSAFAAARLRAEREGRERTYLEGLVALSQRLEKLQFLSRAEIDEILRELESPAE